MKIFPQSAMDTFTDQNFRELCEAVKGIYTDHEHLAAIGWDAGTPVHHIEGAVIAEIHSRMEEFIGERIEVAERIRARHIPRETLSESHTRRRREEVINFMRKHRSEGLSHPDAILNQTVEAVVDNWLPGLAVPVNVVDVIVRFQPAPLPLGSLTVSPSA